MGSNESSSQGLIPNLFTKIGVNLPTLTAQMEEAINRKPRITGQIEADKFYISNDLANILMCAEDAAQEMKDEYVSVEHLVLGLDIGDITIHRLHCA